MPEKEPTLSHTTSETIHAWIVNGTLPAGSVVNERRIAEQLGLSRTPVREALGRLEGEGLLRRDGRTVIVNAVDVREIMEIMALRVTLETECARLAAPRMSAAQIKPLRAAVKAMRPGKVSANHHWSLDNQVHNGIAEASGNRTLLRIVMDLRDRTRMFGLSRIPTRFEPGQAEHLAILDALDSQDAGAAAAAMALHLQNARAAIMESLSLQR